MSQLKNEVLLSNDNNCDQQHEDPLDLESMTKAIDEIGFAQCDTKGKPLLDDQGKQIYVPWAEAQRPKVTLVDPVNSDEILIVKIRQTAYNREVARLYQDMYKDMLSDPVQLAKLVPDPVLQAHMRSKAEKELKKASVKTCGFVVVNFNPDIDFADPGLPSDFPIYQVIAGKVNRCTKKGFIKDWIYSYEQRGWDLDLQSPNAVGNGVHLNFAFTYNTDYGRPLIPSIVVDGFYQLFREFIGSKSAISVRLGTDPRNFINYVMGIKADPEKQELIEADRLWRETLGIAPFYASSQWFDSFTTDI